MIVVPLPKRKRFGHAVELPAGWVVQLFQSGSSRNRHVCLLQNGELNRILALNLMRTFLVDGKTYVGDQGGFAMTRALTPEGTLTGDLSQAYVHKPPKVNCIVLPKKVKPINTNFIQTHDFLYTLVRNLMGVTEEDKQVVVVGDHEKHVAIKPTEEKIIGVTGGNTTILIATTHNLIVLDNPLL